MGFIQGATGNAVPCVIAYPSNITAGSILVASARIVSASIASTCTDTLGNVWVKACPEIAVGAGNWLAVFYCLRPRAGACTVTISQAGATFIRGAIGEWTGSIYNTLDVISVPGNGVSSVATNNSVTSRGTTGLAIMCAAQASIVSSTATAGGGYTTRVNNQAIANDIAIADQATAASAYAGTITYSGSATWGTVQIIFYASQPVGFNKWTPTGQMALSPGLRFSNPNVIYDTSPAILTSLTNVYKMWASPSSVGGGVYYFESADGLSDWHPHPSNPVIAAGATIPTVYKVAGSYYCYAGDVNLTHTHSYTSPDGVVWTDHGVTLVPGAGGTWDSAQAVQPSLCDVVNGVWHFYYQGIGAGGIQDEHVGHLTSTDGITFTKDPANPVFTGPNNAYTSFNQFHKVGSTYYCWATMEVPTAKLLLGGFTTFYRLSAPSVSGPWTMLKNAGSEINVYYPATPQDFHTTSIQSNSSQIGDISMIDGADGNARLYYTLGDSFGQEYQVNTAVAYGTTVAQLVNGFEGVLNAPISGAPSLNIGASSSDNFTRANANPIGAPWTPLASSGGFGTAQIASNLAEPSVAGTGGDSWYAGISGNQWSRVVAKNVSASVASSVGANVLMNTSGVATAYRLFWTSGSGIGTNGSFQLLLTSAGSNSTILQLTNVNLSVGDSISLFYTQNSQLLIYWNDVLIYAITNPFIASGSPGFQLNANAAVGNGQISGWSGGSVFQNAPSLLSGAYSVPDSRVAPFGPNASRNVQGTLIYDVQTSSNSSVPGKDCRVSPNIFIDSRVSPNIPQNSRTPGTYGPGE